jgi:DNA-directed RNA polymerase specialized sigma24 family protein
MIKKPYPVEEINTGIDSPTKEKKQENEDPKEERGSPDGEDDAFPAIASRTEVHKALEEAYSIDSKLQTKLLYFALKYIRFYFHRDSIEILTAKDVVQTVLVKFMEGDRKWDKKKVPNIVNTILMSIISYVRNEWKKMRIQNRKGKIEYVDQYDEDGNLNEHNLPELIKTYMNEDLKVEELRDRIENMKMNCFRELEEKNDVDGYYVFEQIVENTYLPDSRDLNKTIADELGISVKEVENAKKRIRRSIKKFV